MSLGLTYRSRGAVSNLLKVSTLVVSDGVGGDHFVAQFEKNVCSVLMQPPFVPGEIVEIVAMFNGKNTDVATLRNGGIFFGTECWFHPVDDDSKGSPGFRPDTTNASGTFNAGVNLLQTLQCRTGRYVFTSRYSQPLYAKQLVYASGANADHGVDTAAIIAASIAVRRIIPLS